MEHAEERKNADDELKRELEAAYRTIAELTAMLDRTVNVIEKLTDEKLCIAGEALDREDGEEIVAPASPYIDSKGVMEMFGCSQASSYKHLRAAGAASIGRMLIIKRTKMLEYANSIGLKQA